MVVRCLAVLCLSGCIHVHVYTHEHVQGGEGLEPGDRVVAPWQGTLFQGTVITVQGKLVTVSWDDGTKSFVRRDRIALEDQPVPDVREGDWVLCHAGYWQVCQATRLGNDLAFAPTSDGVPQRMDRGVLAVPAGLKAWATEQGSAAFAQHALQSEMQKVQPAAAGQPVQVGARVLATSDAGATWLEAEVAQVGERVTVIWQGGMRSELGAEQVAPLGAADFSEGALVFCKWAGGARWWRAEVTQLSASALTVAYVDSTVETLAPEQCAPAVRRD